MADRHRCAQPRRERPRGRQLAQAAGDRGRSGREAGQRPGLGPRAHGGGEALSVAHGAAPERNRGRRDAKSDQCSRVRFGSTSSHRAPIGWLGPISSSSDRYVVVNLPSTSVEAVENGRVVHRYVAIVGDPDHPSPEISAHIQVINLNPTWTVPTSIIKKEIIPRMQRDPGYLTRAKIRILDGSGQEINPKSVNWGTERAANYTLRQDLGAGNSLGLHPDRDAQQARCLHARHAFEAACSAPTTGS